MHRTADETPRGILHPKAGETKFVLSRFQPSADIGFFVQRYWIVKWDLRGEAPYRQTVLTHPNVNLVFEPELTRIYGVASATSSHLLQDRGWVLGLKFKPGGFYPFLNEPVSRLTDSSVSFREVFRMDSGPLEKEIFAQEEIEPALSRVETFLGERLPAQDDNVSFVNDIVSRIRNDRTIVKVDDAVRQTGVHKRTLQRLFDRYVGVSPKWVIRRYRLHEAAEQMHHGSVPDWSQLSLALGYYDQSHFIRDFRSIVGPSPEQYVRKHHSG